MRTPTTARLIGANIVIDAFGTAVFLAGVGFFAVRSIGAPADAVLNSLAIGTFIGVAASYIAASMVDSFGARPVLLGVQTLQFGAYFGMLVTRSIGVVLVLCAAGAALSRVASPVRGALPPMYLDKAQILEFKSKVKAYTVTAAISGGVVAAGLGLLTSPVSLLAIPGLNCLSFIGAFALTVLLPRRERDHEPSKRLSLYRPPAGVLVTGLLFAVLIGLASTPEATVAVLAAHERRLPAAVVAIAPAVALAVALAGQVLLKGRSGRFREHLRRLLLGGLVLAAIAIVLLGIVTFVSPGALVMVVLVVLASAMAESALLVVTYCMWDVQYSLGPDAQRGGVIGMFSIASSIGMAVAPALASVLFFQSARTSLAAGAVTLAVVGVAALVNLRRPTGEQPGEPRTTSALTQL